MLMQVPEVERNTALYSDLYSYLLWLDFSISIQEITKNQKHQQIIFTMSYEYINNRNYTFVKRIKWFLSLLSIYRHVMH